MHKKVLIIDDEPALVTAWQIRLESAGFEVVTAMNGRSGYDAAVSTSPNVILLDVRMPDMSGYELCRLLRDESRTATTPIVFMTANVVEQSHDEAIQAGGNGFLPKPCDASVVISTLRNFSGGVCAESNPEETAVARET